MQTLAPQNAYESPPKFNEVTPMQYRGSMDKDLLFQTPISPEIMKKH